MDYSDNSIEDSRYSQSFEQHSQSTQPASQQEWNEAPDHIWGYLEPFNREVSRISFSFDKLRYELGRHNTNDFVLSGQTVSGKHCVITWDGCYQNGIVTVLDESLNGTFINGVKIVKGHTVVLRHGNEISFNAPGTPTRGHEDYRFIYRHVVNPPQTSFENKYDILTDLGRGSYGVVKKAVDRITGEYVAVKILKDAKTFPNNNSHPRSHYFRREIEVLQMLKHENICELKEAFFWENGSDEICLVLELVEGGDFLAYLLQHAPLSEVDSQHFTYQICDALAYIHSQNVTHRDLKPENILLTKGQNPIVKVADFGLAKFVHSQTMLKTLCGSPAYLAPEIVSQENSKGYDNLVDSWSVGVMVYSMLTRSSPFIQDEQQDLRTRVLERTIDWTPLHNENPAPEAIKFIRLLLNVNPQHRMTLTNALNHAWFATYTPVHERKAKVNSRKFISAVQGNAIYSGCDSNRHIGSFVASDDSELQVIATNNLGIIKTFNEHVQEVPMRSPREANQDDDPSLDSDEYPPGFLKSA